MVGVGLLMVAVAAYAVFLTWKKWPDKWTKAPQMDGLGHPVALYRKHFRLDPHRGCSPALDRAWIAEDPECHVSQPDGRNGYLQL